MDKGCYGLDLIEKMDWTVGEKVITPEYYAPPKSGMSYTFGILTFEKK